MIDLGLTKLAMIGVVALLVIGPEKLPKVARMAGSLLGRAQRYINDVKSEVSREIELDELRKLQKEVQQEMQEVSQQVEDTVGKDIFQLKSELNSAWNGDSAESIADYPPAADGMAAKAKSFRKKKLLKTSAVPTWYKQRQGRKMRIVSAAARVAKYRPKSSKPSHFFQ